ALSANIIRNLIAYLNANQGGLFIYNDDDPSNPFFDLLAAYAYNRQKFITKHIQVGEGLIGTCALEKQTIHLTNIPENYISISSGLGEAKPRTLLIVPLKIEENVLGIVELASFTKFEDFHVDFVEKVAQSIAQTLTSVRTNIRTAELLERTQQQAEEMKAQEEEVRQNLEELATIKEELEKRNDEFYENQKNLEWEKTLLDALLNYLPDKIYFKDLKSQFVKVSKSTLRFFGLEKQEELVGKSDFDFFDDEHARPAYEDEQRIIRTDTPAIGIVEKEVMSDGRITWAETSKLPLKNTSGETIGTFGITRDITTSKLMEEEINKQAEDASNIQKDLIKKNKEMENLYEAISNSSFVMEYNTD
ncbi:MAG TPA: PAS domain S-box protein, partial [Tenuifilaceae bacterium]|nr:PAS domain S-box protein [Tenuifilaceae bacterium]